MRANFYQPIFQHKLPARSVQTLLSIRNHYGNYSTNKEKETKSQRLQPNCAVLEIPLHRTKGTVIGIQQNYLKLPCIVLRLQFPLSLPVAFPDKSFPVHTPVKHRRRQYARWRNFPRPLERCFSAAQGFGMVLKNFSKVHYDMFIVQTGGEKKKKETDEKVAKMLFFRVRERSGALSTTIASQRSRTKSHLLRRRR